MNLQNGDFNQLIAKSRQRGFNKIPVKTMRMRLCLVGRGLIVPYTGGRSLRIGTIKTFSVLSDQENKSYELELNPGCDIQIGEKLLFHIWRTNKNDAKLTNVKIFRLLRHNDI